MAGGGRCTDAAGLRLLSAGRLGALLKRQRRAERIFRVAAIARDAGDARVS